MIDFNENKSLILAGLIGLNVLLYVMNEAVVNNPKPDYRKLSTADINRSLENSPDLTIERIGGLEFDPELDAVLSLETDCLFKPSLSGPDVGAGCKAMANPELLAALLADPKSDVDRGACYDAQSAERAIDYHIIDAQLTEGTSIRARLDAIKEKSRLIYDIQDHCRKRGKIDALTGFQLSDDE